MKIFITSDIIDLGKAAGTAAAAIIREAIQQRNRANIVLGTGTSQFEVLNQLIAEPGIDWGKVVMFHLDEYIGLPISEKASFRKYLKERFVEKVPDLLAVHLIDGEQDPAYECKRLEQLIVNHPIDVALVGIGENGHLAFNDPPADFETDKAFIVVKLDEACRRQQLGEGWFETLEAVPDQAITMSVRQILKSKNIICSVPDKRKAMATKYCLEHEVSNLHPASILQQHQACTYYLDKNAASLLSDNLLKNALYL
jgi:glucosamine-6-phosphate deaminase